MWPFGVRLWHDVSTNYTYSDKIKLTQPPHNTQLILGGWGGTDAVLQTLTCNRFMMVCSLDSWKGKDEALISLIAVC